MISLIAAYDLARNIGYQGDMPWGRDMKADLKYFKDMTEGKTIVMGRKTFESLPGILPNRRHVVLTKTSFVPSLTPEVTAVDSIGTVLRWNETKDWGEIFIIGGAQIYEAFMPYADRIYLTKIHELFEGDTKFPPIIGKWEMTYGPKITREGDKYPSQYITFERA